MMSTAPQFAARLAGVTYTDREAFEAVAVGFLPRQPRWRGDGPKLAAGEPVMFATSETREYVSGQIWSEAPDRGTWWVRGDDGRTYLLRGSVGLVADSRTGTLL
jgi:hypothetical protein